MKLRHTRSFALVFALAALAPLGCAEATADDAQSSAASTRSEAVGEGLKVLFTRFRNADVKTTGGFGRSLATHLDEVVDGAGSDLGAQRKALKSIFGVDLADDIAPKEFTASMRLAFEHQYRPIAQGAANAGDAANNLAHVDSIVSDIIEGFPDIVRNLESSGIPSARAMDLLLAVAWHDVGKMMDPRFIESVPAVKALLASDAYKAAAAKVPEQFRENYKNKFILQVLCHEFGSIKALEESPELKESVVKRIASFIEDHNDGSGNRAAWWNEQWRTIFGVEYSAPKTPTGFLLSALDRARQGSLEMLTTPAGARRLDGGVIKIAYNVKNQGKPLGFAIDDAVLRNNSRSLDQLRTMTETRAFGELLITKFDFFKKALRRNELSNDVLRSFVRTADPASNTVQVLDHGRVVDVDNLDDFFRRLEDNWDELYAAASLAR